MMKQCPDCSAKNQRTNVFCPMCGHSFLDDPPPRRPKRSKAAVLLPGQDTRRLSLIVAIVIIVVLGLAAGLTSYFVSRQVANSEMVSVKSGIKWKCTQCGRVYKDRVKTIGVKKAARLDYGVEIVTGLCDTCKFGPVAGFYQDALEVLAKNGYFHGYGIDISDGAAAYIAAHPKLFPASEQELAGLDGIAPATDPRTVERDFDAWSGRPFSMEGQVKRSGVAGTVDGRPVTYIEVAPRWKGKPLDLEVLAVYDSAQAPEVGEDVNCYLLPAAQVAYRSPQGERMALLGVAMAVLRPGEVAVP